MATNTYVALKSATISGTSTNSINLDNIPQGYTDLVVVTNTKTTNLPAVILGTFNNDASSLYSHTAFGGNGTSPGSTRSSSIAAMYFSSYSHQSNTWSTYVYNVMNYSNTTTYKTMIGRGSNSNYGVDAVAALYRSTNAITSVQIFLDRAEYWEPGSTFTVYGIANADNFTKATGGMLYEDSTYWYHVFGASGTFTPKQSLTADILVVAGGGAGGSEIGGGGGAGGLLTYTSQSLTATNYTCTVGAGASRSSGTTSGGNGSNSQFGALTASIGGGGGGYYAVNGISGGSGGGAGRNGSSGGSATSGQGYAGGSGTHPAPTGGFAGGGGGAGAAGQNGQWNGTIGTGGAGGVGATSSFINAIGLATGMGQTVSGNTYFAGGGGGGAETYGTGISAGGYGGGGTGAYGAGGANAGVNATVNTGGGGGAGGGTSSGTGGAGGSGIVIIRYPK